MGKKIFKLTDNENYACGIMINSIDKFPLTDEFYNFLTANQIASMAGHIIECQKKNEYTNIELKFIEEHNRVRKYLDNYLAELDNVAVLLAQNGIHIIALKNVGIARGIFNCTGCCPMGDLDILVEKVNFTRAHELLMNFGYNFKYRSHLEKENIQNAIKSGGAEYWKDLPTGEKLWLELQFRPVAGRWISKEQEPATEALFSRSIVITGSKARLLSPEDNLLQVALHTAKHTYVRIPGVRLHTDVERIVRYQHVDWQLFVKMVLECKVKTAVYFSLLIPKEIFQTPIPESVLKELKPDKVKSFLITLILKKAGLFNPENRKFSAVSYILLKILMYDSLGIVLRNIFPSKKEMIERYNCRSLEVYYYYLSRIVDLLFNRYKVL